MCIAFIQATVYNWLTKTNPYWQHTLKFHWLKLYLTSHFRQATFVGKLKFDVFVLLLPMNEKSLSYS